MNSLFRSTHYQNDHCYLSIQKEAQEEEVASQREVQKPKAKSKKENREARRRFNKKKFHKKWV
jgi:hypothetical protein